MDGSEQIYFYDAFGRQNQVIYHGNTYSQIFGLNGRVEVQFVGNGWSLNELYAGSVGDYLGNPGTDGTYPNYFSGLGNKRETRLHGIRGRFPGPASFSRSQLPQA